MEDSWINRCFNTKSWPLCFTAKITHLSVQLVHRHGSSVNKLQRPLRFLRLTPHYGHLTQRIVSSKVQGRSANIPSALFQPGEVSVGLGVASPGTRNRLASPSRCFLPRLITLLPSFLLESRHLNATRVKTGNYPWSRYKSNKTENKEPILPVNGDLSVCTRTHARTYTQIAVSNYRARVLNVRVTPGTAAVHMRTTGPFWKTRLEQIFLHKLSIKVKINNVNNAKV